MDFQVIHPCGSIELILQVQDGVMIIVPPEPISPAPAAPAPAA